MSVPGARRVGARVLARVHLELSVAELAALPEIGVRRHRHVDRPG